MYCAYLQLKNYFKKNVSSTGVQILASPIINCDLGDAI